MTNAEQCSCWRCWFQSSFSALVLLVILVVSFIATIVLMHESSIADKYVMWLEGWDAGILTSLGVALTPRSDKSSHPEIQPQETK